MIEQLPVAPARGQQERPDLPHPSGQPRLANLADRESHVPQSQRHARRAEQIDWGVEQKAWLRETLQASDATFKILISPTPLIGPDDLRKTDNHADVGGFQHERDEFFNWLTQTGVANNFYIVCGDRHWQYHSIYLDGLEEFSCGALIDANSRPGRIPGDLLSTDPAAWIKQPYRQDTPSGGFLMVQAVPAGDDKPASLIFRFYDEKGEVLHEHTKTATSMETETP